MNIHEVMMILDLSMRSREMVVNGLRLPFKHIILVPAPQGMEAPKAIETPRGPGMVIGTLHTSQPATPYVLLQPVFSGQEGVLPLLGGMLHPTNRPSTRLATPFPPQPGRCHHDS